LIHKKLSVGSLFIAGRHKSGAFHFHVVFFCFSPVSGAAQRWLKRALFDGWQSLQHPRRCARKANEFHRRDAEFADRLKGIRYFAGEVRELEPRWWGCWNRALLKKHSRAVTRAEIDKGVDYLGLGRKTRKKPASVAAKPVRVFTMRYVRKQREWCEALGKDWEAFKRRKTGLKGKVSDRAYLNWLNREAFAATSGSSDLPF
jgi:hypothetical protein